MAKLDDDQAGSSSFGLLEMNLASTLFHLITIQLVLVS